MAVVMSDGAHHGEIYNKIAANPSFYMTSLFSPLEMTVQIVYLAQANHISIRSCRGQG